MIAFKDVFVAFNGKQVLNNFNLEVNKSDKILIFGKSGIGKSTIINLLLGFQTPDAGEIFFNQKRLDKSVVWEIRKSVSYVSQDMDFGEGKIGDLITDIFSYRANKKVYQNNQELNKHLEYFNLPEDILDQQLQDVSGGEKQRVALIIALLLQKNVFLLDEATSALDGEMKQKVIDLFTSNRDWTVIVISHDSDWQKNSLIKTIYI